MSRSTLLALAADEIISDPYEVLGLVDPQLGQWPHVSIVKVPEAKLIAEIDD